MPHNNGVRFFSFWNLGVFVGACVCSSFMPLLRARAARKQRGRLRGFSTIERKTTSEPPIAEFTAHKAPRERPESREGGSEVSPLSKEKQPLSLPSQNSQHTKLRASGPKAKTEAQRFLHHRKKKTSEPPIAEFAAHKAPRERAESREGGSEVSPPSREKNL